MSRVSTCAYIAVLSLTNFQLLSDPSSSDFISVALLFLPRTLLNSRIFGYCNQGFFSPSGTYSWFWDSATVLFVRLLTTLDCVGVGSGVRVVTAIAGWLPKQVAAVNKAAIVANGSVCILWAECFLEDFDDVCFEGLAVVITISLIFPNL